MMLPLVEVHEKVAVDREDKSLICYKNMAEFG